MAAHAGTLVILLPQIITCMMSRDNPWFSYAGDYTASGSTHMCSQYRLLLSRGKLPFICCICTARRITGLDRTSAQSADGSSWTMWTCWRRICSY